MSYYGNILTLYQASEEVLAEVAYLLTAHRTIFTSRETTFFVETSSMAHTEEVIAALKKKKIAFTFFHNHIATGSGIAAGGLPSDFVQAVRRIMFSKHFPANPGYSGGPLV